MPGEEIKLQTDTSSRAETPLPARTDLAGNIRLAQDYLNNKKQLALKTIQDAPEERDYQTALVLEYNTLQENVRSALSPHNEQQTPAIMQRIAPLFPLLIRDIVNMQSTPRAKLKDYPDLVRQAKQARALLLTLGESNWKYLATPNGMDYEMVKRRVLQATPNNQMPPIPGMELPVLPQRLFDLMSRDPQFAQQGLDRAEFFINSTSEAELNRGLNNGTISNEARGNFIAAGRSFIVLEHLKEQIKMTESRNAIAIVTQQLAPK